MPIRGDSPTSLPGPGAFQGTRFVKGALFELSGGAEQWQTFDQAMWDRWSPELWAYLRAVEPCLWRSGRPIRRTRTSCISCFANGEVDLTITQAVSVRVRSSPTGSSRRPRRRSCSTTTRSATSTTSPSRQRHRTRPLRWCWRTCCSTRRCRPRQIVPENGFGLGYAIDPNRVTDPTARRLLADAAGELGAAATDPADLASALVGDAAAAYQDLVETVAARLLGGL